MTAIRLSRDYPHVPSKVWRALTEPSLMALWGLRAEGYSPVVGTCFRLVGKKNPAWRGYIECEVLEVRAPSLISYSWEDGIDTAPFFVSREGTAPPRVTYRLEPHEGGTRLTYEHTGFTGVAGFTFVKLLLIPGMKKMLDRTFPAVLSDLDETGNLRATSILKPAFGASR